MMIKNRALIGPRAVGYETRRTTDGVRRSLRHLQPMQTTSRAHALRYGPSESLWLCSALCSTVAVTLHGAHTIHTHECTQGHTHSSSSFGLSEQTSRSARLLDSAHTTPWTTGRFMSCLG